MDLRTVAFFAICLHALTLAQAQSGRREIVGSIFNNAIAMPFSGKAGVIHSPFHPGISMGIADRLNKHNVHQLSIAYKFAYLFQQRVQHVFHLYPELRYKLHLRAGLALQANLGAGYMHSFSDLQQFKLNTNGEYQRTGRGGRPALLSSFTLGAGYDFQENVNGPASVFIYYQLWFQSPFVNSYVPVLPNNALHLGAAFRIKRNRD